MVLGESVWSIDGYGFGAWIGIRIGIGYMSIRYSALVWEERGACTIRVMDLEFPDLILKRRYQIYSFLLLLNQFLLGPAARSGDRLRNILDI